MTSKTRRVTAVVANQVNNDKTQLLQAKINQNLKKMPVIRNIKKSRMAVETDERSDCREDRVEFNRRVHCIRLLFRMKGKAK